MAITLVGVGAKGASNNANVTLGEPSVSGGHQTNDVWIAAVYSPEAAISHAFTDWTQVDMWAGTGSAFSVWYFRYAGSVPNLTVTIGNGSQGDSVTGGIASFRGVKTSGSPVNAVGARSGSSGTLMGVAGVDPTVTDCMLVIGHGSNNDNSVNGLPTGFTAAWEDVLAGTQQCYVNAVGNPDSNCGLHYKIHPVDTATGTLNVSQTGSNTWLALMLALEPSSGTSLTPSPAAVPLIAPAPTLSFGAATLSPTAATIPLVAPAPTISLGALTMSPGAVAVPCLAVAPTVSLGALTLTPSALACPVLPVAPTVSLGALTLTPAALVALLAMPAVTVDFSTLLSPNALTIPLSVPDPTLSFGALTLTPAALSLPLVVPAVTIGTGMILTPNAVAIPLVLPSPGVSLGTLLVAPNSLATPVIVPSPTVTRGALTVTPDVLPVSLVLPGVSVSVDVLLTPDALAVLLSLPGVTLEGVGGAAAASIYRILRRRR